MYYQFFLTDTTDGSKLYEPYANTIFTWDEVQKLLLEARDSNSELHWLITDGSVVFRECKRLPRSTADSNSQHTMMGQVQSMQNEIYSFMRVIPNGTFGRTAIVLAWESMRLGWYMMRGNTVGIHEKSEFVKLIYEQLMDDLSNRGTTDYSSENVD